MELVCVTKIFIAAKTFPMKLVENCHILPCYGIFGDVTAWTNEMVRDVITIVAMFTIVAINYNCCNTNHNCRKKITIVASATTIVAI